MPVLVSHHTESPHCHSRSTVRESSVHCEHCDSELSWHASFMSWHKVQGHVATQGNPRRFRILQGRETPPRMTSPAQRLQERDIRRCVHTPHKKMYTRSLCNRERRPSTKGSLDRHTSTFHPTPETATERQGGSFFGDDVQTNQGTSLRGRITNTGPEFRLCESERLLLNEEEEELATRPVLSRNLPDAGCRAQTHHIPRIQRRPDPFPARSFPHLLQIFAPTILVAIQEDTGTK